MKYLVTSAMICALIQWSMAANYDVGPGQTYTNIGDVPLENLVAGDSVIIHFRVTPYAEKFAIGAAGTQSQPVVFYGVADGNGNLPVITGDGATTRTQLDFWNEVRGLIKIGGTSSPSNNAAWVVVENLELRSARPGFFFDDDAGNNQEYVPNAAAVFIEQGANVTLRNLVMHDCGNGLFVASASSDVMVEYCHLYDNGIENSIYEHNSYTESDGIIFQYNKYGTLRTNCLGNNLKDRSMGLVVRYNWIYGGNRQLDLVDSGQGSFHANPKYNSTFVYGNILIEFEGEGNRQMVHYGGDSGDETQYRKGTMYFYNNTCISNRSGNNTMFRLSSMGETIDARNNVMYADGNLEMSGDDNGTVDLRNNWIQSGWVDAISPGAGSVNDISGNITGSLPGFINQNSRDHNIAGGSSLIGNSTTMHASVPPTLYPVMEFVDSFPHYQARNDYDDMGAISYQEATGIEDNLVEDQLHIFPNPSNGTFVMQVGTSTWSQVRITDIMGKMVWQQDNPGSLEMQVLTLEAGVYTVVAQKGHTIVARRLVVQ